METKNGYKDLIVWQKSMRLGEIVYKTTADFPKEEQFGIVAQLRRAVVSIPSNIAEGYGRRSEKEYRHFLSVAYGSLLEVETQLLLSEKLGYCKISTSTKTQVLLTEISKMLNKMCAPLRNS